MVGTVEDSLLRHGYVLLASWVFLEQIGLPLPAAPVLLAAGAIAGTGRLSLLGSLVVAVLASLVSDLIWFYLGKLRGTSIFALLCRLSLERDSCARRTENIYAKHGFKSLLVAKFIPGLGTAAPPVAGAFGMRRSLFLLFDGLGSLLWAGAFLVVGYSFSRQLRTLLDSWSTQAPGWQSPSWPQRWRRTSSTGTFGEGSSSAVYGWRASRQKN